MATWTTKVDGVDKIYAAHINALQDHKLDFDDARLPYYTPEQFGAVGDGVVNDSAAINAALAAAFLEKRKVVCSSNLYRVDAAIVWPGDNVTMEGNSAGGTVIRGYGAIQILNLTTVVEGKLKDIQFIAMDFFVTHAIYGDGANIFTFDNVLALGGNIAAIEMRDCYVQRYFGCRAISSTGIGIYLHKIITGSNDIQFFGTGVQGCDGNAFVDEGGAGRYYQLYLEDNGGGLEMTSVLGFVIDGGYYEKNVGFDIKISTGCRGGTVGGMYLINQDENDHRFIWLLGCRNIDIGAFHAGIHLTHTGGVGVYVDTGTENITINPFNLLVEAGSAGVEVGGPDELSIIRNGNLIPNSNFDSMAGWTATDCTAASVAGGVSGNCLEITRTGGAVQFIGRTITGLVIGATYRCSYYVKSGTSGNEDSYIQVDPGGGSGVQVSAAGWVRFFGPAFAATATSAMLYVAKLSATAGTMLFDEVRLERI